MNLDHLRRANIALGVAAIVACVFAVTPALGAAIDFVQVRGLGIAALSVPGAVAIASGLLKIRALGLIAGVALVLAALLQLAQLGQDTNLLGGDASTVALLGGLGLGLVSIWLGSRDAVTQFQGSSLT